MHGEVVTRIGPGDCDGVAHGPPRGLLIEQTGDSRGNACTHEHTVDACQHGTVNGISNGDLDLLQKVHADES